MENVTDSEFKRFVAVQVLAYLKDKQLESTYKCFIEASRHLEEERKDSEGGYKQPNTSIGLVNIVRGYLLFKSQIKDFLRTCPDSFIHMQLIETNNLVDRLKIILNQFKETLQASYSNSNEEKERNSIEDEFDDSQSNNLINSDIQRFVACQILAYFQNQQLRNVYKYFIEASRHLEKERKDSEGGYKQLNTSIGLVNIVRDYLLFKSQMDDFMRTAPESPIKIQLIEIDNPLDRLRIILKLFKQNLQKSSPNSDSKRFTNPVKKLERISLRAPFLRLKNSKDNENESNLTIEETNLNESSSPSVDASNSVLGLIYVSKSAQYGCNDLNGIVYDIFTAETASGPFSIAVRKETATSSELKDSFEANTTTESL